MAPLPPPPPPPPPSSSSSPPLPAPLAAPAEKKKLPWGLSSESLTPGSMRTITDAKIKAFQQGVMNSNKRTLSKREQEELKRKQEEEATAEVYREFVASFGDSKSAVGSKEFVKGDVIHQTVAKTKETSTQDKGRLYKPAAAAAAAARISTDHTTTTTTNARKRHVCEESDERLGGGVGGGRPVDDSSRKRKSNLEAFKDELKRRHEQRGLLLQLGVVEEDNTAQKKKRSRFDSSPPPPPSSSDAAVAAGESKPFFYGRTEDQSDSTNLFVSNISRSLSEMEIMRVFGGFGALASVKIMYPRSDEERARGTHCGFVAFMRRADAESAIVGLNGSAQGGLKIRLGWGKAISLPRVPVYGGATAAAGDAAAAAAALLLPPAAATPSSSSSSGLPFNAQLSCRLRGADATALEQALVRVITPTDPRVLATIHRTLEFVIREGPEFEAALMVEKRSDPSFGFLFDNHTPAHVYYRWKLFSLLNGDSVCEWRSDAFRMFERGSLWIPPPPPPPPPQGRPYSDHSYEKARAELERKRGRLTNQRKQKLNRKLAELTVDRDCIAECMVFCIDNADAAEQIIEAIIANATNPHKQQQQPQQEQPVSGTAFRKLPYLFLIGDILFNCGARVANASFYRKGFETRLREVFENLRSSCKLISSRIKAEQFKLKVIACLKSWEGWAVYPNDLLLNLRNVFLGVEDVVKQQVLDDPDLSSSSSEDIDGKPMSDEKSFDEPELVVQTRPLPEKYSDEEEDIDGRPLDDDH